MSSSISRRGFLSGIGSVTLLLGASRSSLRANDVESDEKPMDDVVPRADEPLDPFMVRRMAYCSQAAYQTDPTQSASWSVCGLEPLGEPITHPKENLHAFVGVAADGVVISFRGTQLTRKNVVADSSVKFLALEEEPTFKVHLGFWKAFSNIEEGVRERLEGLDLKSLAVSLTGHSLGGALAVIAAYKLQDIIAAPQIFTFGQPQIGNGPFAAAMQSRLRLVRFVHAADPIPYLPGIRYRDFGRVIYFNGDKELTGRPPMQIEATQQAAPELATEANEEKASSLSKLAQRMKAGTVKAKDVTKKKLQRVVESVDDHRMSEYVACVEKNFCVAER